MTGDRHVAANHEWRSDGPSWISGPLRQSLTRSSPSYCVGLPPNCCLPKVVHLHHEAKAPVQQRTFATLFLHGNLSRMGELMERFSPVTIGPGRDIDVPARGVESGCDFEPIILAMLTSNRPMFASAGPLANVIIDLYWQRQVPENRQIVLDVGSAMDHFLDGSDTRYYHQGRLLAHHCALSAAPLTSGKEPASNHRQRTRQGSPMPIVTTSGTQPRFSRGHTVTPTRGRTNPSAQASAAPLSPALSNVQTAVSDRSRCTRCSRVVRSRK